MAILRNTVFFMFGVILASIVGALLQPEQTPTTVPQVFGVNVSFPALPTEIEQNQKCMALNLYREAGNQSVEGMGAVASVVLNRAKSGRFPDDICAVIYQKRGKVCQFSWVCKKSLHTVVLTDKRGQALPGEQEAWQNANKVAWMAVLGMLEDSTQGADHYHATYVKPVWRLKMARTAQVGTHIFYKEGSRA